MTAQKKFLITGVYSGIGRATAQMLSARGHIVIGLDIREPDYSLDEYHHCDLSNPESIDGTLIKLKGTYASLLNVAGVPSGFGSDLTMKVNILGLRQLTDGIWSKIEDRGTVVNVSSLAGNNWRNHLS